MKTIQTGVVNNTVIVRVSDNNDESMNDNDHDVIMFSLDADGVNALISQLQNNLKELQ